MTKQNNSLVIKSQPLLSFRMTYGSRLLENYSPGCKISIDPLPHIIIIIILSPPFFMQEKKGIHWANCPQPAGPDAFGNMRPCFFLLLLRIVKVEGRGGILRNGGVGWVGEGGEGGVWGDIFLAGLFRSGALYLFRWVPASFFAPSQGGSHPLLFTDSFHLL